MTQEEKRRLLAGDLMSRVNYWIDLKVDYKGRTYTLFGYGAGRVSLLANPFSSTVEDDSPLIEEVKPYLRPMSSMTKEECIELGNISATIEDVVEHIPNVPYYIEIARPEQLDWLNAHHFDYRGLIEKGIALEAPEGMYKF